MGLFSTLLSFVQYLDSHNPFREFNYLPEALRLTDVLFDYLLGAVQYFLFSSILEFQLNLSGQHKQRIIYRSVPESTLSNAPLCVSSFELGCCFPFSLRRGRGFPLA